MTVILESAAFLLATGVCAVLAGFSAGGTSTPDALAPQVPGSIAPPLAQPSNCMASPRDAMPSQRGNETIVVRTTRGADAYLVVHYPTVTRSFTIVADSAGTAVITFPIGRSIPGTPVQIDVSTNSGQICGTQFTPQ